MCLLGFVLERFFPCTRQALTPDDALKPAMIFNSLNQSNLPSEEAQFVPTKEKAPPLRRI